jgi:hypothetical protein
MMPKAVGMSLQDAQDLMQKVTGNPLYVSTSTDLRFTRLQVLDSNWKVCRQKRYDLKLWMRDLHEGAAYLPH